MAEEIEIVDVRSMTDPRPENKGGPAVAVFYRRGANDPRMVLVKGAKPSAEEIKTAIRAELTHVDALKGQKFTL